MLVRVYIWKQRKKICIPTRGRRSCDQQTYFGRKVIRFSILKYGGHCKHSRSRGMSYLANRNSVAFPDNSKNAVAVKSSCIRGSSCSKKTIPNMLVSCMLYRMPRHTNCRIFIANQFVKFAKHTRFFFPAICFKLICRKCKTSLVYVDIGKSPP